MFNDRNFEHSIEKFVYFILKIFCLYTYSLLKNSNRTSLMLKIYRNWISNKTGAQSFITTFVGSKLWVLVLHFHWFVSIIVVFKILIAYF